MVRAKANKLYVVLFSMSSHCLRLGAAFMVSMEPLIDPKVNMIYYEVIIFSVSNLNLLLLKGTK